MHQRGNNCCISRIRDVLVDAVFSTADVSPEDSSRNKDCTCEEPAPQNKEEADNESISIVDGPETEKEK